MIGLLRKVEYADRFDFVAECIIYSISSRFRGSLLEEEEYSFCKSVEKAWEVCRIP